jgi:hypothetical protein
MFQARLYNDRFPCLKVKNPLLTKTITLTFMGMLLPFSIHPAQSQAAHKRAAQPPAARGAQGRPAASNAASNVQVTAYLNRLRGKLVNNWLIPDGGNHVTLTGNFNQDGLSDNIATMSSPKNGTAENAAMEAFNKCMPLEAMPTGFNGAKLTVEFSSTADPHGDSKSNINLRLDPVKQAAPPKTEAAPAAQAAPDAGAAGTQAAAQ